MTLARMLLPCLLLPGAALAAPPASEATAPEPAPPARAEPVRIDAETMRVKAGEQRAVFTGDVRVRRGLDRLTCEKLTVRYDAAGAVESFVAEGAVHMRRAERHLRADRAELDNRRGLLTLTGEPVLEEGQSVVRGEVMRYDLDTGEVEVLKVRAEVETGRLRQEETP